MSQYQYTYTNGYLYDALENLTPAGERVLWRESIIAFNEQENVLRSARADELTSELSLLMAEALSATEESVQHRLRRAVIFKWLRYLAYYNAAADEQSCRKAIAALLDRQTLCDIPLELTHISEDINSNQLQLLDKTDAMNAALAALDANLPFIDLGYTYTNDYLNETDAAAVEELEQDVAAQTATQDDLIDELAQLNVSLERLHESILNKYGVYLFRTRCNDFRDLAVTRSIHKAEQDVFALQLAITTLTLEALNIRLPAITEYIDELEQTIATAALSPPVAPQLYADLAAAQAERDNIVAAIAMYTALQPVLQALEETATNDWLAAVAAYDAFIFDPNAGNGIGVIQPQSGLDYPFLAPSDDVANLVADFYLSYDDSTAATAIQHPLRIQALFGFGCNENWPLDNDAEKIYPSMVWESGPHPADIVVVDANDHIVFRSRVAGVMYKATEWGDLYTIVEWESRGQRVTCRIVVRKKQTQTGKNSLAKSYDLVLEPENAVLDERAVYRLPKRVRSITAKQGNIVLGQQINAENNSGVFSAGYNMTITPDGPVTTAVRRNTNIIFAAPGRNEYVDCDETPTEPILKINGVAGTNGDFTLSGAACIYARRPTTVIDNIATPQTYLGAHGYYEIGSDCPACCDCPDYVNTATYMNRIRNRYKTIGSRVHGIKLLHESNIQRWLENRECRLAKPLKIVMTPQCCPLMDVLVMFCNQCQSCVDRVTLNIEFSTFPEGVIGEQLCGYTILYAPGVNGVRTALEGAWPSFSVTLASIDVGNSAYVKFRLKFSPRTKPYTIIGTVTATKGNEPLLAGCEATSPPAIAFTANTLACNLNGEDIRKCEAC